MTIRLSAAGLEWVDRRALAEGITIRGGDPNRSELVRLALTYASIHMPKGWRP
jgi:hypothetical protein